ncbi:uroporphyrinogen decarboxylase family protein [Bacteroidota bacterium]
MKRRRFIQSTGTISAVYAAGMGTLSANTFSNLKKQKVDKREAMLSLINDNKKQDYYPGGFFIHFDREYHFGEPAINKHLEYFRYTDLDFIKIQYENIFPKIPGIQKPSDWSKMPLYKKDFYNRQLKVIEGIIKKAKSEAMVVATFYSPFACAGDTASPEMLTKHLNDDPDQVKKGMEIISESLMIYVKHCIKLGVDGFLQSTQGGEANRFKTDNIFADYIKPFDVEIGTEMVDHCPCNILHICDWNGNYHDYSAFKEYPGHIINCSLQLEDRMITSKELYSQFSRPIMGGLHKRGIIVSGSQSEIISEVKKGLSNAPEKFVLGASCTLPGDINWDNIKVAVDTAHEFTTQ